MNVLSLNPIKTAIAPYVLYIKLAIAAVFLGSMFFLGRGCGVDSMEGKVEAKQLEVNKAQLAVGTITQNYNTASASLLEANRQTEANQQFAREAKAREEWVLKENEDIKEGIAKQQSKWEKELAAAKKKDPDCAELLARKVCIAF